MKTANRHGSATVTLPSDREILITRHGEYRTIEAPRRLVSTEVFEGYPDAAALDTVVFEERAGVTTMTVTVLHTSQEHRDGHIASGMESGMQVSMNRLEDVVAGRDRAG